MAEAGGNRKLLPRHSPPARVHPLLTHWRWLLIYTGIPFAIA